MPSASKGSGKGWHGEPQRHREAALKGHGFSVRSKRARYQRTGGKDPKFYRQYKKLGYTDKEMIVHLKDMDQFVENAIKNTTGDDFNDKYKRGRLRRLKWRINQQILFVESKIK